MMQAPSYWIAVCIVVLIVGAFVWVVVRLKIELAVLKKECESYEEKIQWVQKAKEELSNTFQALASKTLQTNTDEFRTRSTEQLNSLLNQVRGDWDTHKAQLKNLVEPLGKTLETMDVQVRDMEQKREGAYSKVTTQLNQLVLTHQELQRNTTKLEQALRSSTSGGRWGERELQRIVEMAGMTEHVSFDKQVASGEGRPDMVVYLLNGGILPVDAKTPMQAYLDSFEAVDEKAKQDKIIEHSKAMRARVRELANRKYWEQFEKTPEIVVMFVPSEPCLGAAFGADSELLDYALEKRVLPTTPVTLLALLKAVAYGWQQQQITENAQQIADLGKDLFDRIINFFEYLNGVGKGLDNAVKSYNQAISSLGSRLIPKAREFKDLSAATKELPIPTSVYRQVRELPSVPDIEVED
ncbi:MAG: DNA recombination protein RmuC [bacterium]